MSEGKSLKGISRTTFIVGLLIAILASSCISTLIAMRWVGLQGPKGDKGEKGDKGDITPVFDSGWVDITDKAGQYFNITHNLNSTEIIVDITGKTTANDGVHQRHYGGTGYAQGWNRTYACRSCAHGGTDWDVAISGIQTRDGGYAIAGYTGSFPGDYDFWLVKTDAAGNEEWNQTYGGTYRCEARSIVQTGDDGYALAGFTNSSGTGSWDYWLVKTDPDGNMEWNQTYGGAEVDSAYSVVQTGDGGYAIAGYTSSYGAGGNDFWLVRTDLNGDALWNWTYGGLNNDYAFAMVQTDDGGYAMTGYTKSFGAGSEDCWLVKTNSTGHLEWNQTYGGVNSEFAESIAQTIDGGYAMAGATDSFGAGSADFWLVKTDAVGNEQWNETYGGGSHDYGQSVVQTFDGGYAIAGYTSSYGAGSRDFWLVRTDSTGSLQWNQTYGGADRDYGSSVVQTNDGGYAIAGATRSFGAGDYDCWLVKTDPYGVAEPFFGYGLAWVDSTADTITLYRDATDAYWNYVRVRIWKIEEIP